MFMERIRIMITRIIERIQYLFWWAKTWILENFIYNSVFYQLAGLYVQIRICENIPSDDLNRNLSVRPG